jgi:hypothetical protein
MDGRVQPNMGKALLPLHGQGSPCVVKGRGADVKLLAWPM